MSEQVRAEKYGVPVKAGLNEQTAKPAGPDSQDKALPVALVLTAILLTVVFWKPFLAMYHSWNTKGSYYSHGFLIPPIVLYLVWLRRHDFLAAPRKPSSWGYPLLGAGLLFMLLGGFLDFMILQQLAFLPIIAAILILYFGFARTFTLWFPIVFTLFMIPIPTSLTQSISLNLKLLASESAVRIANVLGFPMIRDGSFIHFNDDYLLVGEVCGGLRSLIALLAIGVLMAYFSQTRPWARLTVLLMAGPVAILANIIRILTLCIVGYYWGSEVAAGRFHDISGVLIFVVAFILFFALEGLLRWLAPAKKTEANAS